MKEERIYETVNRKRDNIIKNAQCTQVAPEFEEAAQRMEDYLRSQQKRCTVERRFILQKLYSLSSPVDSATLHAMVCSENGNVALTTVYNTLQLLVNLKLARRLDLVSHGMTFFERTLGQQPHGFVICEQCGALSLINDPDVLKYFRTQLPRGFTPDGFTLHIHGLCAKCQRAKNKTHKKKSNNPKKNKKNNES